MRRADRLFQIVQHLRGGRLVTAKTLSERLEVSERTIYRDVADLMASGVPIDGEAGVGYILRSGFDLPPLGFIIGARCGRSRPGASFAPTFATFAPTGSRRSPIAATGFATSRGGRFGTFYAGWPRAASPPSRMRVPEAKACGSSGRAWRLLQNEELGHRDSMP
jgi:biotin operon repressor